MILSFTFTVIITEMHVNDIFLLSFGSCCKRCVGMGRISTCHSGQAEITAHAPFKWVLSNTPASELGVAPVVVDTIEKPKASSNVRNRTRSPSYNIYRKSQSWIYVLSQVGYCCQVQSIMRLTSLSIKLSRNGGQSVGYVWRLLKALLKPAGW